MTLNLMMIKSDRIPFFELRRVLNACLELDFINFQWTKIFYVPLLLNHSLWCAVCDAVKGVSAEVFKAICPCCPASWCHQQIHSVWTELIAASIKSVTHIITNAIRCRTIVQCISAWIGQSWVVNNIAVERTTHDKTAECKLFVWNLWLRGR